MTPLESRQRLTSSLIALVVLPAQQLEPSPNHLQRAAKEKRRLFGRHPESERKTLPGRHLPALFQGFAAEHD
jgi:hypothetical protein